MYLLIIGGSGIGQKLAQIALDNKDNVAVIDKDEDRCKELAAKYDVVAIHGDATLQETLEGAEIGRVDAVATTADDATNLLVISIAKNLGVPSLVSVIRDENRKSVFREKGANVIGNPDRITGEYMYRALKRPMIRDFMSLAGGQSEVLKISVPTGSKLLDKPLGKIKLPKHVSVMAVDRGTEVIVPDADTQLEAGDSVIILARENSAEEAMDLLHR
ncbi:MAG: TrkA family potassium uptake protein [Thermoplasmatota archaeon]